MRVWLCYTFCRRKFGEIYLTEIHLLLVVRSRLARCLSTLLVWVKNHHPSPSANLDVKQNGFMDQVITSEMGTTKHRRCCNREGRP